MRRRLGIIVYAPALMSNDGRTLAFAHGMERAVPWSAATAQVLGFPDPSRDADLLSRARRTATGGWLVPLTEMPLDLDNPSHLDALMRAHERFPEIGGRVTPG